MRNERIVYYHERENINVGDYVNARIWFRWKSDRVVYVPGISNFNPNMEYNELQWVGIQIEDGPFLGIVVDPKQMHGVISQVVTLNEGRSHHSQPDAIVRDAMLLTQLFYFKLSRWNDDLSWCVAICNDVPPKFRPFDTFTWVKPDGNINAIAVVKSGML